MTKLERAKLERAKQQTRRRFQETLRYLPKLSKSDFEFGPEGCAFCAEYSSGPKVSYRFCSACPVRKQCSEYRTRRDMVLGRRYWRKPAAELCRWVLREVDKVLP